MRSLNRTFLVLALACFGGASASLARAARDIPLSKVPPKILAAARQAVPGIEFTEAELQKTPRGRVYEVEGIADGQKYEIKVAADGEVLRTERDNEDGPARNRGGAADSEDPD